MVRMTVGWAGSGSILRRMRVMRTSMARSKASRGHWRDQAVARARSALRIFGKDLEQRKLGARARAFVAVVVAQDLRIEVEPFGPEPDRRILARSLRRGGRGRRASPQDRANAGLGDTSDDPEQAVQETERSAVLLEC